MEPHLSISESEWRVMKTIWQASPQTLPEILDNLKETGWSKTTIQTYLARLVKKGALSTERQGKGYLYYPVVSESECQLAESRNFLSRVYDGSLSKMVMGFVKSGNLSHEELDELKALIDQQEKNDADTR
ncbi:MAG: BlaI/MecI/CopY family transcriptional regulator [Lacrimispora saccharolytica]